MMKFFLSLPGRIWGYVAVAAAVLAALVGAYLRGRKDQADKARDEELNEYVETRKRLDQVEPSSDADAARERLRKRVKSGGNL